MAATRIVLRRRPLPGSEDRVVTQRLRCAAVLTAAALFTPACSSRIAAEERSGQTSQAIVGGTNDTQDTVHANVVVGLSDGVGHCSGTLLTPTVVLTAGHCYYGFQQDGQNIPPNVTFGPNETSNIATNGHPAVLSTDTDPLRWVERGVIEVTTRDTK